MIRISSLLIAALALGSTAVAESTNWRVSETVNPLDDTVSLTAQTTIDNEAALVVGCSRGMMFVGVQASLFDFKIGDLRQVAWRIDSDEAIRQSWQNSSKGGAAVYDEPALNMAKRMRDAERRIVIASGGNTRQFSVRGSTAAIARVLAHCDMD